MPAKRFLLTLMISMHRGVNIDYRYAVKILLEAAPTKTELSKINPIQDGPFWGCTRMRRQKGFPP